MSQPTPEQIERASKKFHAFEWLRAEALKGNRHAEVLVIELVELNKRIRSAKK